MFPGEHSSYRGGAPCCGGRNKLTATGPRSCEPTLIGVHLRFFLNWLLHFQNPPTFVGEKSSPAPRVRTRA